jgi:hypothetical protein
MNSSQSDKYYPAFITTELIEQERVAISGERIVVVLGTDEKTGLPLELSICLRNHGDAGVSIYAIKEPVLAPPLTAFPELIVEEVPAVNVRRIYVRYGKSRKKGGGATQS